MSKILKVLGIIFLFIIILFVILLLSIFIKSKTWESNFYSTMNSEYMITKAMTFEEALNEKIAEYVLSQEYIDNISFSPIEVGQIVKGSLLEITEDSGVDISNVYIEPTDGLWEVCALARLNKSERLHVWVCADMTKDNIQTAQIYLKKFLVQGINIGKIYPQLLININSGIAEALVTVNENNFAGRVFENIELLKDQIVIKGSLY